MKNDIITILLNSKAIVSQTTVQLRSTSLNNFAMKDRIEHFYDKYKDITILLYNRIYHNKNYISVRLHIQCAFWI